MNRVGRILAVTAGLAAGGFVFGGMAAILAFWVATALTATGQPADPDLFHPAMLARFATGGAMGAVLFPAAGFLLMRTVPLGLALLGTLLGTMAGGIAGWMLPAEFQVDGQIIHAVNGALLGFLVATVLLRVLAGRAARREATRVSAG
ncbi:MAG TPA: hypothetical protein VF092_22715 [Longimicrobium sp.]